MANAYVQVHVRVYVYVYAYGYASLYVYICMRMHLYIRMLLYMSIVFFTSSTCECSETWGWPLAAFKISGSIWDYRCRVGSYSIDSHASRSIGQLQVQHAPKPSVGFVRYSYLYNMSFSYCF